MDARAVIRPRRAGKKSAARRTLRVEVVDEGSPWGCLGGHSAKRLTTEVSAALVRHVELAAPRCTATLVLANDTRLRELNQHWRAQDKPTNVLSFPAPHPTGRTASGRTASGRTGRAGTRAGAHFLGDVIVAEETLVREAAEQGITAVDHFRHLLLHGLLHLAGYDHETDEEAEAMEALETLVLADVGVADPYASSTPVPRERPSAKTIKSMPKRPGTANR